LSRINGCVRSITVGRSEVIVGNGSISSLLHNSNVVAGNLKTTVERLLPFDEKVS
jgi:hypothetical protein